ncbi:hypothetical protein [Pseudomonas graminis]|uniref:hypothetical protein n=1 Tax=Pseudomonas graminis TaxID=158627 RepID=UPI003C1B1270
MNKLEHKKSLSAAFVLGGMGSGVLLFFLVLVWFIPGREEVVAHFRVYMVPIILFGFVGKLMHEKGQARVEVLGKYLLGWGYVSCGAFVALFVYTFFR